MQELRLAKTNKEEGADGNYKVAVCEFCHTDRGSGSDIDCGFAFEEQNQRAKEWRLRMRLSGMQRKLRTWF